MTDPDDQTDVETFAEALLAAIEERLDLPDVSPSHAMATAAMRHAQFGVDFVRRYCRLEIDVERSTFDSPVLFVANHGFGGIFDLNVFATYAALDQLELDRPVTALTHQLAWTLGVGPFIEPFGARPASHDSAREAFAEGQHVLVFPGGDIEAGKPWDERNQVVFGGRSGFARLAIEYGVPIVPIVTAGASESLLVMSREANAWRGRCASTNCCASRHYRSRFRCRGGSTSGRSASCRIFRCPPNWTPACCTAMHAEPDEEPDAYAERVQSAMQSALDEMTANRKPLLG